MSRRTMELSSQSRGPCVWLYLDFSCVFKHRFYITSPVFPHPVLKPQSKYTKINCSLNKQWGGNLRQMSNYHIKECTQERSSCYEPSWSARLWPWRVRCHSCCTLVISEAGHWCYWGYSGRGSLQLMRTPPGLPGTAVPKSTQGAPHRVPHQYGQALQLSLKDFENVL